MYYGGRDVLAFMHASCHLSGVNLLRLCLFWYEKLAFYNRICYPFIVSVSINMHIMIIYLVFGLYKIFQGTYVTYVCGISGPKMIKEASLLAIISRHLT